MYDKEIRICGPNKQGYLYFCDIKHPLAMCNTCVLLHRHVLSMYLGRWLLSKEFVHHLDGNKLNNNIENLIIMSNTEHAALHRKEEGYLPWEDRECAYCHKLFHPRAKSSKYCCWECQHLATIKFNVTKEQLFDLVWKYPTTKVALFFGVTDKAIDKRCHILGICKPPRGYWMKLAAVKTRQGE